MLDLFLSYLLVYKYTVLFCVIAAASFGLPLPATALLIAAGAFAAQGYLNFGDILLYGLFASILGDMLGYIISLRFGKDIFIQIGLKQIFLSQRFVLIENIFIKHSASTIFSSRFLATNLGPIVNILAGLTKINYKKFLFYDVFGELFYVILYSGLGFVFSSQWETISQISGDITSIIILVVILIILFVISIRIKNGNKL
ncbi:MAG: DedA family protein [Candidatus Gracilibacteria bacterium]